MLIASDIRLVVMTCPDLKISRMLAKLALEEQLVACINFIHSVDSMYLWKDEVMEEQEYLLLAKTKKESLDKLESLWISNHPYDVPEFIVLDVAKVNQQYDRWVERCVLG